MILMMSRNNKWELAVDLRQWIVGANYHEGCGWNIFLLCFRIGYAPRADLF